jgi:6-phosphogluconolactonase
MHLSGDKSNSQNCRWHTFQSTTELEQTLVAKILWSAQQSIDIRGSFHIVLAGGSTPKKIYEALRNAKADWTAWHIYYGDERCLPVDHVDRNSHMAATGWLNHVAIPAQQIHPIPTEEEVKIAAAKYAQIVKNIEFFDLVLLGLGEDGHTASLFPNHDPGDSEYAPDTMIIMDAPKPPPQRISLSARRLSKTHQLFFIITGINKSHAVKDWRSGVYIPATTVTPENGVDIYIESALVETD